MIKLDSATTQLGIGIILGSASLYFSGQITWQSAILAAISGIVSLIAKAEDGKPKNIPVQDLNIPEARPTTVEEALRQRRK